jgi:S-adenosylmethionine-diacylgycerolhomoserine-N-methlytransferase
MDPSTLPTSPVPPEATLDRYGLDTLSRFYRWHAPVYDWTRPLILFGRNRAVRGLDVGPGSRVLDVGCGTGWNLPLLQAGGAEVVGIECAEPMLKEARARRLPGVKLDPRPYGTHADYAHWASRILFSYSLSMIPPYAHVLERAREDLSPGGRIAVVDFSEATRLVALSLKLSHVNLGRDRLNELSRLFPKHRLEVHSAGLWHYFLFWGEA